MTNEEQELKNLPSIKSWEHHFHSKQYQMGISLGWKHFRIRLNCMIPCEVEVTIQAENEQQAAARTQQVLKFAAASIDSPLDFHIGSKSGTSPPVDVKVTRVQACGPTLNFGHKPPGFGSN